MKQLVTSYSYSPTTNVVTLTGVNIDTDQLLLISAPQVGRTMYNFASGVTGTVVSGANTRVTLNASTAGLTTTSPLVIFYDDHVPATSVTGTVALDPASLIALENVTVTVGAAVTISNFPSTQTIAGTVTANLSATNLNAVTIGVRGPIGITDNNGSLTVDGSVSITNGNIQVSNFPPAQSVLGPYSQYFNLSCNIPLFNGIYAGGAPSYFNTPSSDPQVQSSEVSYSQIVGNLIYGVGLLFRRGTISNGDFSGMSFASSYLTGSRWVIYIEDQLLAISSDPNVVSIYDVEWVFGPNSAGYYNPALEWVSLTPVSPSSSIILNRPSVDTGLSQPLTNTQLRASAVTVSGTVTVGNSVTIGSLPAISGTVTARLQDASGNNLTSTSIGGVQRLNVSLASAATAGGTLPSFINVHGGTDGSVARTMLLDSSGRTVVTVSNFPATQAVSLASTTVTVSSLPNVTIGNSSVTVSQSAAITVGALPSGALTTRFGSVTTANTAQITSAVTNTSRKYLLAQNISTGSVTIGIGFSPTTTQGIQLAAGAGLTFDAFCPTGAVYWLGAVTGADWTILEG